VAAVFAVAVVDAVELALFLDTAHHQVDLFVPHALLNSGLENHHYHGWQNSHRLLAKHDYSDCPG
jgi:hypothetical protein